MSDEEPFVELFEIRSYSGIPRDLEETIEELTGVQSVSLYSNHNGEEYHEVQSQSVKMEISYDPIETDRTQIVLNIEEFENVGGEVTNA